jgi:CHAD domain-containing protein
MGEAARQIVRRYLAIALTEAPGACDGDVEATHAMRVALRKLRTALRTFDDVLPKRAARRIGQAARRIARHLGVVRDADVHLAALRPVLAEATAGESDGIAHAMARLIDLRKHGLTLLAIELSQLDGAALLKLLDEDAP